MLVKQGFELHQQARFSEAIPLFQQARKLEPGDYFANLLLGIDLLRTGKPADAVPFLKLAAKAKPSEEFPEDYLGEAEATMNQPALAAEAYEQAMLRGHNSEQSIEAWAGFALERYRQIGERLRASQAGVEVAQRLQMASSEPRKAATPTIGCARLIPLLEQRIALKPAYLDTDAAFRLSICYAVEAGDAAAHLQSSIDNQASVHRLRGDVLLRLKGDAAGAEAEYKIGLGQQPDDPELLERLADAQLAAGDAQAAKQSAQSSLAVDPHRSGALRTLSVISMNDRDYEQALPLLQQLRDQSPGDPTVAVELGRALAQTGKSQEALDLLAPALDAGYPDEKGSLHALLARVLRKLGRDAEATKADAEARRLSDSYQASGGGNTEKQIQSEKVPHAN
jgi:predicted Zn-dependent protease